MKTLLQVGTSKDRIAHIIGTHKSTVYRELNRNQGKNSYDPEWAQMKAEARRRSARKAIRFTDDVKERIESLLRKELTFNHRTVV